jgi:hypothetical protein
MSDTRVIQGIVFEVWESSFAVRSPFIGPVIWVGRDKRDTAMEGVARTVLSALRFQIEAAKVAFDISLSDTQKFCF